MQKRTGVRSTKYQKTGKRAALGLKEKRRLTQLILCVGLFIAVLLGKGIAPAGILESGEKLLQMIRADTDFESAFLTMGETVADGGSVWEGLGQLAAEVFGANTPDAQSASTQLGEIGPAVQAAKLALTKLPTSESMLLSLGVEISEEISDAQEGPEEKIEEPAEPTEEETEPEPAPDPTPEIPVYTGPALPEGATMDYCELGLSNTVTPVFGALSSAYGYRDHPVDGEYTFHTGVDLAADIGTPVLAFADGTVDFIGESEAYGLYVQLNHGNGVTTFYCHCSKLLVQTGAAVSAGQTIAEVGETGNATGAHLHMELEQDGVLLNPLYYIEIES